MSLAGVYPCAARDAEIWRLFEDEHVTMIEISRRFGLSEVAVKEVIRRWRKRHGIETPARGVRVRTLNELDATTARPPKEPTCPCGLRIDKDHTPETCDMRTYASRMATAVRSHWSDDVGGHAYEPRKRAA